MSIWITYRTHYGTGTQLDRTPDTYSGIAVFDSELEALRYANGTSTKAVEIYPGESLEEVIKNLRDLPLTTSVRS